MSDHGNGPNNDLNPHPDEEDDDMDDIANLFSFGADDDEVLDALEEAGGPGSTAATRSPRGRTESDPFLDMHLNNGSAVSLRSNEPVSQLDYDQATQDILEWLDESQDPEPAKLLQSSSSADQLSNPTIASLPPAPENESKEEDLPLHFHSLEEALRSSLASLDQIRQLCKEDPNIQPSLRAELYCRLICGKDIRTVKEGSLVDSFQNWVPSKEFTWVEAEVNLLSPIVATATQRPVDNLKAEMEKLTRHYYENQVDPVQDLLVPHVLAVIISTGIPVEVASVVSSQFFPKFAPLLTLKPAERWDAALILHREFYLLACYHLPLLVFHLDRYLPGWYWPKRPSVSDPSQLSATLRSRNQKQQGCIPSSWLLSLAAGEQGQLMMPINLLLRFWDHILSDTDNSLRFFWGLAILEKEADNLLLITGDELARKVAEAFSLDENDEGWFSEWYQRSTQLQKYTPTSVVNRLREAEDKAVNSALRTRQKIVEEKAKARMEEEAQRNAEEARVRLTRARLVAFYRKHAPEKEQNVDKIMETYRGKYEALDNKLLLKYGERFNPAQKPVKPESNSSTQGKRSSSKKSDSALEMDGVSGDKESERVTTTVLPSEVLPAVLGPREGVVKKRFQRPIKFYLVDSRPHDTMMEQGHFPGAVNLAPDVMLDPDRSKESEELFESFRGAVHFVVIGEGWRSIPTLFDQKLTPKMADLARQDESRTNICALFLLKRGFPFVSILEGGFASAYAFLVREGSKCRITLEEALLDFDESKSIFSQMEILRNSTATERAQRMMQNALDRSVVALTKRAMEIERLASDMETKDSRGPINLDFFKKRFRNKSDTENHLPAAVSSPNPKTEKVVDEVGGDEDPGENESETKERSHEAQIKADPDVNTLPEVVPKNADAATQVNPLASFRKMSERVHRPQGGAKNPFKGIGAQFNRVARVGPQQQGVAATSGDVNQSTTANPGLLKRNPFARFGEEKKKGFGEFAKASLSRVRSGEKDNVTVTEEESISFQD